MGQKEKPVKVPKFDRITPEEESKLTRQMRFKLKRFRAGKCVDCGVEERLPNAALGKNCLVGQRERARQTNNYVRRNTDAGSYKL